MASEPESTEPRPPPFERLFEHGSLSSFPPLVFGMTDTDMQHPRREGERIVLVNPLTQGMVVIEGTASFEALIRDLATKYGHPPASKASIEALAGVDVADDDEGECAICLEKWAAGDDGEGESAMMVVKEMPCKHKFHGKCVEKWLGIHGSCPICRFKLPVGDEGIGKKREEEEEEERGRRRGREVWVSFSFNRSRRNGDSDDINTVSATNLDHHQIQD